MHIGPRGPPRKRIGAVGEAVQEVHASREGTVAQPGKRLVIQVAHHPRGDRPDQSVAFPHVLPDPHRGHVRERIDRRLADGHVGPVGEPGHLALGGRVHECDDQAGLRAPRDLGGAEDRGGLGLVHMRSPAVGRERRSLPHPPRVEEVESPHAAEPEEPRPFDEERTPFLEAGLEGRQVDHRGVRLHLAEVGVEGGVQGKAVGQPVLEVDARVAGGHRPVVEGAGRIRALVVGGVADRVRQNLQPPGPADPFEAEQVAELGGPAGLGRGTPAPGDSLAQVEDVTPKIDPPHLALGLLEAQLGEGNLHLGDPPQRIDPGCGGPHRIPAGVDPLVTVVGGHQVVAAARGRDAEDEGRAVVVVRVDLDLELVVGLHEGVAPSAEFGDLAGVFVVHAGADVQRVVRVRDPHFGAFAGGVAVAGAVAPESGDGYGDLPDGVVQAAVEGGGGGGPDRGHGRGRVAVAVREGGVGGGGNLGPAWCGSRREEGEESGGAGHGVLACWVGLRGVSRSPEGALLLTFVPLAAVLGPLAALRRKHQHHPPRNRHQVERVEAPPEGERTELPVRDMAADGGRETRLDEPGAGWGGDQ